MQPQTDFQWWRPSRTIRLFGPNRRFLHSIAIIAAIHASSAFVFTQTSAPSNPMPPRKFPALFDVVCRGRVMPLFEGRKVTGESRERSNSGRNPPETRRVK